MMSALVSALQAMGYNKGNGRNNNRGTGNSSTGRPDPYPSEPCLNCGLINHTREKCIKKKVTCRFCGKERGPPASLLPAQPNVWWQAQSPHSRSPSHG